MTVQLHTAVPEHALRFQGHDTHSHDLPHLIHAFTGYLVVRIEGKEYVLQEGESLWLAPQVPHAVRVGDGGLALGPMLYSHARPPQAVTHVGRNRTVEGILRQAIFASARTAEEVAPFRKALCAALLKSSVLYFHLPWPHSPLGQAVAAQALGSRKTLAELASAQYSSVRQIQRIFREETGLTFSQWRRRGQLNRAYRAAVRGLGMGQVVKESGYASQVGLAKAWAKESTEPFEVLVKAGGGKVARG